MQEIIGVVKDITTLYKEKLGIEHVQIVNSNGRQAQQDVFHIHYHIVPRYSGDGQSIRWQLHPEWRPQFDEWLARLRD